MKSEVTRELELKGLGMSVKDEGILLNRSLEFQVKHNSMKYELNRVNKKNTS